MYPFFWDPTFILILPAVFLALYAQWKVQSTFSEYSKVASSYGMTGAQVARRLLDANGLNDVPVEASEGALSDHYDPQKGVLRLSSDVHGSNSVAALGVAAHEVGHAIQGKKGFFLMQFRNGLVPVANIGSTMAFPLFFLGFLFQAPRLMDIGILVFGAAVLFQVVTLPVELDASRRALAALSGGGYLSVDEQPLARKVLQAAALTYVAALAMAVLQLLRLLVLRRNRDD